MVVQRHPEGVGQNEFDVEHVHDDEGGAAEKGEHLPLVCLVEAFGEVGVVIVELRLRHLVAVDLYDFSRKLADLLQTWLFVLISSAEAQQPKDQIVVLRQRG